MFDPRSLEAALDALGATLADRGERHEVVAVGGGGLLLLGLIERPTRDLDLLARVVDGSYVLAKPIPDSLAGAIVDVARAFELPDDWVNAGPTLQLEAGLPVGFESRLTTRTFGFLTIHLASRTDQIFLKLYAAADDGPKSKHVADLRALTPTSEELRDAAAWVKTQDAGPEFAEFVDAVVATLLAGHER